MLMLNVITYSSENYITNVNVFEEGLKEEYSHKGMVENIALMTNLQFPTLKNRETTNSRQ